MVWPEHRAAQRHAHIEEFSICAMCLPQNFVAFNPLTGFVVAFESFIAVYYTPVFPLFFCGLCLGSLHASVGNVACECGESLACSFLAMHGVHLSAADAGAVYASLEMKHEKRVYVKLLVPLYPLILHKHLPSFEDFFSEADG